MTPNFSYIRPKTVEEAIRELSTEGARLHAGGTDLLGCLRDHIFHAKKVVSMSALTSLRGIVEAPDGGIRIGALTTITEVADHPLIRDRYRALAQAASEVGSPQLRNQGTIGGNICQKPRCWYYRGEFLCLRKGGDRCYAVAGENRYHCILGGDGCYMVHPSDTAPALIAVAATFRVAGPKGSRTVPAEDFFMPPGRDLMRETVLLPGEIVTEILIPRPPQGLRSSYRKVRARQSWDFAVAGAAIAVQFDGEVVTGARIVLSGAAPIPWRSKEAERETAGRRLDAPAIGKAAAATVRNAQPLAQNDYKIPLFRGIIEDELSALAKG